MAKRKSPKNANLVALAAMMRRANLNTPKKKKKTRAKRQRGRVTGASMGPVASIATAPVAIGNSVRGSESVTRQGAKGCVVTGRDFMFTPIGTNTVTTWTMVGGTPLTPAAFVDSSIRQYMQMYQKYRLRRFVVHYITSSPTSSTGDVMFYYGKNRDSVFLNQTSSFLLPFVLSDPSTVIGPQWTNHSAVVNVASMWKSTDYGMDDALNSYADGELFLLSKTSSTDSPGYVLFDYEIEFAEHQVSPRLLTLPIARIQYSQLALATVGAKTQGNAATFALGGNNLTGVQGAFPTGFAQGDIYKVIVDVTNSTFTTGTAANLIEADVCGIAEAVTLTDGFTCYALASDSSHLILQPNCTTAFASTTTNCFAFGASLTYSVNLQVWISYVGQVGTNNWISNF